MRSNLKWFAITSLLLSTLPALAQDEDKPAVSDAHPIKDLIMDPTACGWLFGSILLSWGFFALLTWVVAKWAYPPNGARLSFGIVLVLWTLFLFLYIIKVILKIVLEGWHWAIILALLLAILIILGASCKRTTV